MPYMSFCLSDCDINVSEEYFSYVFAFVLIANTKILNSNLDKFSNLKLNERKTINWKN